MTEKIALLIFASIWGILLAVPAVTLAYSLYKDRPKKQAGIITNFLIAAPYVFVFSLFYLDSYFGVYEGNDALRISGAVVAVLGMAGYLLSHLYLRRNWSLLASVREGHRLIVVGPYRFVRHPMYSSMTATVLGSGLLVDNWAIIASTVIVGCAYYFRARKEETLLTEEFPEYRQYARKTKMFIPGIF